MTENIEDVGYDESFEDYIVIKILTPTIYPLYPLPDGDWECDLKNGLFRRFVRRLHGDVVVYGRFGKSKTTGEWIAVGTGWGNAYHNPDSETWESYTVE